jgi:hypothetical protein
MEMAQAEQPRREPGSCLQLQDSLPVPGNQRHHYKQKELQFLKKNEVNPQILYHELSTGEAS